MTEKTRGREDGRLGILGQVQLLGRSVDASLREVVAEETDRDVKDIFRLGEVLEELLGHADVLRALDGEDEGCLHSVGPIGAG